MKRFSAITIAASAFCCASAFAGGSSNNALTALTNALACSGDTVTFSTVASGPTPYVFEWRKNNVAIAGKTSSNLTLANVSSVDAATYSVKLTGGHNSVTNSATLTLRTPVSASPLTNLIRSIEANAVFSTTASGTGPFTYVWRKNGAVLAGKTSNSLTLTNLTISDSGTYSVIVGGICNSVTNSAVLTVDSCFPSVDVMLVIDRSGSMSGKPYNDARLACSNFVQNLHFTTNGDLAGLASYNSTATLDRTLTNNLLAVDQGIAGIPAASGNTSISLGLQTGQNELASNRHRTNALPVIVLLSDGLPTGNDTPSNALYIATQAKNAGTRVFTVGLGSVDPALMASIASSPSDYFYTTNSSQLSGLFNAISTIICRPPTNIVSAGPSNQTVCAGSSATFTVSATGCDSFAYQWEKNGVRIPGQTKTGLTLANVTAADAGIYSVEILNTCQTVTNSATLTVNQPVLVTVPPQSRTNCPATPASFTVSATGTALTYQWFKNGGVLNGQTGSTLSLASVSATDAATYSVAVSGACGTAVTNAATLTVTALPVITCSQNKSVQMGVAWTFDSPSANYPVTIVSTTTNFAGHCGNTFDATRTWVSKDNCGNQSAPCSQTVTVNDSSAPTLNCNLGTNKTVQIGTAWTFDPPTASDNGGSNFISIVSTTTNTAGHCGNTFDATRTWVATDMCGNVSTPCSQTVNVTDTTAPTLDCSNSTNKTVQIGTAWTFDVPTATDNGGTNITLTIVSTTTNTAGHCGNTFDATRTWTAKDACGNVSASCSQTVTVIDTTAPALNCSSSTNKTVQIGTAWTFNPPTATDNSGSNFISIVSTTTNTAGHCGNTFDATRTWTASDACGNVSAPCSQTVTVIDTTAPALNCSSSTNKTVQIGTTWTFNPPTATDNSGSNFISIVSTTTNTAGHCGNTFDATRTWVATDACGNVSAPCSQTVSVIDTTAPALNCSSSTNKTVQIGSAWTFDVPTATDNGGSNFISIVSTTTNTAGHCGNTFDATRTWVATDACGNVSAPCSQTVSVIDTTAPALNCGSSINKTVQIGNAWTFDVPTATDNGGSNFISIVSTTTNTAGHCGNTFDATRTWVATDACGNVSAPCSQTVSVIDTTAPALNCSSNANKTVQLGTAWTFDPPTATDNSGSNFISIVSTTTNTAGHCGSSFDATRTWVATDACGNVSAPCSQTVTVNDGTPIKVTAGPLNQTNCAGDSTSFTISAQGTSLTYSWTRGGQVVGTSSTLVLTNVSSASVGVYTVIVADSCGNTITNSARLDVNTTVAATALSSVTNNLGTSVTFATTASGTGPFTYVWKKNGTVIPGATTNSITLTNLSFADGATYSVEVTGKCGTVARSATLTINVPPTVTIINPTNGTIFMAPATFAIAANAFDVDGVVTNVEFFRFGTNKIGQTTNSLPGLIFVTNLPAGNYTFTAAATDNLGARGTSAPVSITVMLEPPLTVISAVHLDLQTGLFIQTVRVFNPTFSSADAARVYISNLPASTTVHNASGVTNGVPYVQSAGPVASGGYVDLIIEYADPFRTVPNPTLHAALVTPEQGGGAAVAGIGQHIDQGVKLVNGNFLVEFLTISNRLYFVEYSSNLFNWKSAQPAIVGTGTRIQWIDNGEPKTDSAPSTQPVRFYRVVLLP